MTELFGTTRSVVKGRYALLTPESLVPSHLPGWEKAVCYMLISPALGARFSQLLITLERDGKCAGNTGANQYFVYVLEGAASILLDDAEASPRSRQLRLPSLRPGRSNRQRGCRHAPAGVSEGVPAAAGRRQTGGLRRPRARSQRPALARQRGRRGLAGAAARPSGVRHGREHSHLPAGRRAARRSKRPSWNAAG